MIAMAAEPGNPSERLNRETARPLDEQMCDLHTTSKSTDRAAMMSLQQCYHQMSPHCCTGGADEDYDDVDDDDEDYEDDEVASTSTEARHFSDVCASIASYSIGCMAEIARIERHLRSLSLDDQALLIEDITSRVDKIKNAVLQNQKFLDLLLLDQKSLEMDTGEGEDDTEEKLPLSPDTKHHGSGALLPGTKAAAPYPVHERRVSPQRSLPNMTGTQPADTPLHPHAEAAASAHPGTRPHSLERRRPLRNIVRARNASKVRSTLRQFVRDWSDEGKLERNAAYEPLLQDLDEYLNLEEFKRTYQRTPRILCPGSGLGRLPFEVVLRGYGCQGNEFSYYMLLGSNLILNSDLPAKSCTIYPYCLSTSNRLRAEDHLQEIKIPDLCPGEIVDPGQDFSMCAGEFVEVYWDQEKQWDGILTSFFIDTAKNVLLYIRTIARILRPGGLWANLGPLLYHFAEMPHEVSIELSWEEVRSVIQRYFTILKEESKDAYYTTNYNSMMQVQYHCIHFVAVRNTTPMEGVSAPVF